MAKVLKEAYLVKEALAKSHEIQNKYNEEHGIVPKTIIKTIKEVISNEVEKETDKPKMSKKEKLNVMLQIEEEMKEAAKNMDFERAMELRDILFEMKSE